MHDKDQSTEGQNIEARKSLKSRTFMARTLKARISMMTRTFMINCQNIDGLILIARTLKARTLRAMIG